MDQPQPEAPEADEHVGGLPIPLRGRLFLEADSSNESETEEEKSEGEDGVDVEEPQLAEGPLIRNQPLQFTGPLTHCDEDQGADDSDEDLLVAEELAYSRPHKLSGSVR